MAEDCALTIDDVRNFIVENNGKVTNHELVKHFKKYLSGSERQAEARAQFKEFVNTVATIKQEDGVKYLVLKKRYRDKGTENSENSNVSTSFHSLQDSSASLLSETSRHGEEEKTLEDDKMEEISNLSSSTTLTTPSIIHSYSSPCILDMASATQDVPLTLPLQKCINAAVLPSHPVSPPGPWSTDLPPGHTPQPPPRRRNSAKGKENRGAKIEECMRQLNEEKENMECPREKEIEEIVSPGSVKEKAQKLNKMASEIDLTQKCTNVSSVPGVRRRDMRSDKGADDDDTASVSTLDPRRKEWMIKAAKADYHELLRLLREEPKLANCKTALHWAAKHGNLNIIKLIAGTYKANTNARSGYTPLHVAAMYGREEIMEVLINSYGADPTIRDYSGKRPHQYLERDQAQRFVSIFPTIALRLEYCGKGQGRSDKDVGFIRIGSLNSKVKKTAAVLAGGKALTRMKSWGSADNLPDRMASHLMPPPKSLPKKKKVRKHSDYLGVTEGAKGRSADSDSDSTSGMT